MYSVINWDHMLSRHNEPAVFIWKQLVSVSNINILALIKKGCIQDYMSWKVSNMSKYTTQRIAESVVLSFRFRFSNRKNATHGCILWVPNLELKPLTDESRVK